MTHQNDLLQLQHNDGCKAKDESLSSFREFRVLCEPSFIIPDHIAKHIFIDSISPSHPLLLSRECFGRVLLSTSSGIKS